MLPRRVWLDSIRRLCGECVNLHINSGCRQDHLFCASFPTAKVVSVIHCTRNLQHGENRSL